VQVLVRISDFKCGGSGAGTGIPKVDLDVLVAAAPAAAGSLWAFRGQLFGSSRSIGSFRRGAERCLIEVS